MLTFSVLEILYAKKAAIDQPTRRIRVLTRWSRVKDKFRSTVQMSHTSAVALASRATLARVCVSVPVAQRIAGTGSQTANVVLHYPVSTKFARVNLPGVLLVEKDASVTGMRKMSKNVRTKYAAILPASS